MGQVLMQNDTPIFTATGPFAQSRCQAYRLRFVKLNNLVHLDNELYHNPQGQHVYLRIVAVRSQL